MKTISYNLRKNRAAFELNDLASTHDADILCLQEAVSDELPDRLEHLRLVHTTANNRLGLAIYVREERFQVAGADTFQLKKSLHDRILTPANERLLGVKLLDHETDTQFIAASFHAAPLTALNSLRRSQIRSALVNLSGMGPGLPVLMVGDYNYPVFQDRLRSEMTASGIDLTISDKRTYSRYGMFRGHFDFATSIGLGIDHVKTLGRGTSDHLPILITASFERFAAQA